MTQRVFDVDNEQDIKDLWDILPDDMFKIKKSPFGGCYLMDKNEIGFYVIQSSIIKIDWHDKNEITRPIQEATEADIGKLCAFWNDEDVYYGKLGSIRTYNGKIYYELKTHIYEDIEYLHCRRLTKQEIEELC